MDDDGYSDGGGGKGAMTVGGGGGGGGRGGGAGGDGRERWSSQEDQMLADLVAQNGKRWTMVAELLQQMAPGVSSRTGKQCRARYMHHLDPEISSAPWTAEEEAIVVNAQRTMGNKWAQIAKLLPGRTDNAVKNVWYSKVRKISEVGGNNTAGGAAIGGGSATQSGGGSSSEGGDNAKPPRRRKGNNDGAADGGLSGSGNAGPASTEVEDAKLGMRRNKKANTNDIRQSSSASGKATATTESGMSNLHTLNALLHFVSLPEIATMELPAPPSAPLSSMSDMGMFIPAPLSGEITKNLPTFDIRNVFTFSPHDDPSMHFAFNQQPGTTGMMNGAAGGLTTTGGTGN